MAKAGWLRQTSTLIYIWGGLGSGLEQSVKLSYTHSYRQLVDNSLVQLVSTDNMADTLSPRYVATPFSYIVSLHYLSESSPESVSICYCLLRDPSGMENGGQDEKFIKLKTSDYVSWQGVSH